MSEMPKLIPEERAEAAILYERLSGDGNELEQFVYYAVFIRAQLERDLTAERERADRAKAEGIKEGMRRAAEICRARAVKLAPEHTAHTGDGCYDCGAEDEADYLALAILKEAGE